ncbi:hypothetical protein [Pseudomonas sp. D(2018)]|uniref:hypothetical protein n=1 Tax=Pseudomonas sp. D(2018) TaxID=2502238 RepID=UPI0010F68833|nr:hypothetical protein [Pseudomonas sp. D(2018)]
MTTTESVLGVLPVCRVVSLNPTQPQAANGEGCGGCVLGVLGLHVRARLREFISFGLLGEVFFSTRGLKKPYQPNTHYTDIGKALFLLGLFCVGCVLGWRFLCWVGVLTRESAHD